MNGTLPAGVFLIKLRGKKRFGNISGKTNLKRESKIHLC